MSDSLWLSGLQHARLPCPALSPGVCSSSCPLRWVERALAQHPTLTPLASPVAGEGREHSCRTHCRYRPSREGGSGIPAKLHPQVPSPEDNLRLMLGWAMKMLNHTCQPSKDREQGREQELPEVQETQRQVCRVGES